MQSTIDIQNYGVGDKLTTSQIYNDITVKNALFVIRWGWDSGGGHFLTGFGYYYTDIDDDRTWKAWYMNPLDGNHLAYYTWVSQGGNHTWTHTNRISSVNITNTVQASIIMYLLN